MTGRAINLLQKVISVFKKAADGKLFSLFHSFWTAKVNNFSFEVAKTEC